jgi:ribosomal protein L7Ae-like RNA K-turn-binding protein
MSLNNKRIYSLLGLAMKAGKVASGEFMTEKSVKSGAASMVIVAEEASANTKKNFSDMCAYYQVPLIFFGTKEELGAAIGKEFRASLAVNDDGFAKAIRQRMESRE